MILDALLPVFLIIALGHVLARRDLLTPLMWEGIERISYHVLFPLLLVQTLATADFRGVPVGAMAGAMLLAVVSMTAIMFALRPLLLNGIGITPAAFTSVFQGATRWNTFAALAIMGGLLGPKGITLTSVGAAAMIPYLNVVCVLVLVTHTSGKRPNAWGLVVSLAKNPFIWSVSLGVLLNLLQVPIWKPLLVTADQLGRAALAMSLLVVGAGLKLPGALSPRPEVLLSIVLKLAVMPLLMVLWCTLLGVDGAAFQAAVISGSVMTASAAYILARQMNGDAELMAAIITTQTIATGISMPVVLWLLGMG